MSLVIGNGPLSPTRIGWYSAPVPTDLVYVEPHPRRVQAMLGGEMVIDTARFQVSAELPVVPQQTGNSF